MSILSPRSGNTAAAAYGATSNERSRFVLAICNFTPVERNNYRIGVPRAGRWRELLNSDAEIYGGSGRGNLGAVEAVPMRFHERAHSLCLTLPPLSMLLLKNDR